MSEQKNKKEIISFIVELMKNELSYSEIKARVILRYRLSDDIADNFVREAFESVSFLAKNVTLSITEKLKVIVAGLLFILLLSFVYFVAVIYTGYNLLFLYVVFAYILSMLLYILSSRKGGVFLEFVSGIYMVLCYLFGEYLVFADVLGKEFQQRGISIGSRLGFLFLSIKLFFTEYLSRKSIYEFIILGCAILITSSFFFRVQIKRIRE